MQVAANMAWACNQHMIHQTSILLHTSACVPHILRTPSLKPQAVANIMYAMADARFKDTHTLQQLLNWAAGNMRRFSDQERANMAWACARLNLSSRSVFDTLQPHVLAYADSCESWLQIMKHRGVPPSTVPCLPYLLGSAQCTQLHQVPSVPGPSKWTRLFAMKGA
jgi:hypothetical protein